MQNPQLEKLQRAVHPELADALHNSRERILARWVDEVRKVLPTADELTLSGLRNNLPNALEDIVKALRSDAGSSATRDLLADSAEHGVCRFHQSYNLNELLIEYNILRGVLVEEVVATLQRPLEVAEFLLLSISIDQLIRKGVVVFVQHQTRQLQAATEAQSKYLSFLSHDLRGALNGILLMTEVLRRDLANEPRFAESIEDLDMMRRSIYDTVATMDRFLHAERLRNGKVQLKLSPVSIVDVIHGLSAQFVGQARAKGLAIELDGDGAGVVRTDRELLTLVLQNLLGNAIKYSQKGVVKVFAGLIGPPGEQGCRISVIDNGPGIAAERLQELFAPFQRGETHGQSGLGLGLSIAHQAAEILGAKLHAESQPGKGSTFHLDLPPRQ
jgi:signal transduction histidine kinase